MTDEVYEASSSQKDWMLKSYRHFIIYQKVTEMFWK